MAVGPARWVLRAGVAALAVGLLGLVGTGIAAAVRTNMLSPTGRPAASSSGMMGRDPGGMMGSMMSGAASDYLSAGQARQQGDQVPGGATADRSARRITFSSDSMDVRLTALASPPGAPDMTFRIAGMTDPTIMVPAGATVTIELVNGDADTSHGWMLIDGGGSFPYMPMMDDSPAFPGSLAMPLGEPSSQGWPAETVSFVASTPGTYSYICPVPGHAQKGMHGRLIVAG